MDNWFFRHQEESPLTLIHSYEMRTKDKIFTSFIILILYGAAFVNPYGNKSIFGDNVYFTLLVTPILFWFIIKSNFHQQEESITIINYAIILLSTLLSIIAITDQFNIMRTSIYPPTKIAGIVVLSLPYIIKQYSLTKNTKQKIIIAFLLVLDIFGVLCCESRTAFLAILLTSLYLLIDRYKSGLLNKLK